MRKFHLSLLIALVSTLLLGIVTKVHAGPNIVEDILDLHNRIDRNVPDLETWEYHLVTGALKNMVLGLSGPPENLGASNNGPFSHGGLGGILCGTIAYTLEYSPSIQPIHHLARMFRVPIKAAYAQTGTSLLTTYNFEWIWKICRNVAYVLMIVVLVALGFMIMFGAKVDPKTTITLQMALPRVAITLILITFSYAIGGFFIDFANLLKSVLGNLFGINWGGLGSLFSDLTFGIAGLPPHTGVIRQIPGLPGVIKGLGWMLFFLVFQLMAIITLINIFISFLGEWANLFIYTAFSPIFILGDAFPRKESKDTPTYGWFKNLLASSVSIPIMGFLLWLAHEFAKGTYPIEGPGFITTPSPINYVVAFGILLMITAVPASIKSALGVLPPSGVAGARQKVSDLMKTAAMVSPLKKIP